jgi:hypothetical protein
MRPAAARPGSPCQRGAAQAEGMGGVGYEQRRCGSEGRGGDLDGSVRLQRCMPASCRLPLVDVSQALVIPAPFLVTAHSLVDLGRGLQLGHPQKNHEQAARRWDEEGGGRGVRGACHTCGLQPLKARLRGRCCHAASRKSCPLGVMRRLTDGASLLHRAVTHPAAAWR